MAMGVLSGVVVCNPRTGLDRHEWDTCYDPLLVCVDASIGGNEHRDLSFDRAPVSERVPAAVSDEFSRHTATRVES